MLKTSTRPDALQIFLNGSGLIILITLVCMVAAGVASFVMPKIYKISTAIEAGIIGDKSG